MGLLRLHHNGGSPCGLWLPALTPSGVLSTALSGSVAIFHRRVGLPKCPWSGLASWFALPLVTWRRILREICDAMKKTLFTVMLAAALPVRHNFWVQSPISSCTFVLNLIA